MVNGNSIQFGNLQLLPALIRIVRPQLTSDYNYYNIINSIWGDLRKELEKAQKTLGWKQLRLIRERLRRMFEICGFYTDGIKFAKGCLHAARQESKSTIEQAWILTKDLGWLLVLDHKYNESISKIEEGLALFTELSKANKASAKVGEFYALRYLGVAHQHLARINSSDDFSVALNYFSKAEKAIRDCAEEEREGLRARICNNYGNIAVLKGKLDEAENYFRSSEGLFSALKDDEHLAIVRINLGRLYLSRINNLQKHFLYDEQTRLLDKAEKYLKDAINKANEIGWVEGQARAKENLVLLENLWVKSDKHLITFTFRFLRHGHKNGY